jgi:hypothetical protein
VTFRILKEAKSWEESGVAGRKGDVFKLKEIDNGND